MGIQSITAGLRLGATPDQWRHFAQKLNLLTEMYPIVCRVEAKIAKGSSIKTIGKIPSLYTGTGIVIGIQDWPRKVTSQLELDEWAFQPDYGFCINCRTVRALDVDVDDAEQSAKIKKFIVDFFKKINKPCPFRYREGSPRFLVPFKVEGQYKHNSFHTNEADKIEFLGNGQQFQATGMHTKSYTMYEWEPAFPETLPEISKEQLTDLWQQLTVKFAVGNVEPISDYRERSVDPTASTGLDAVGLFIQSSEYFRGFARDGALQIHCPFKDTHSCDSGPTETVYFPPSNGYEQGHFKCLHGHCANKTDEDFLSAMNYNPFDYIQAESNEVAEDVPTEKKDNRFKCLSISEFNSSHRPSWIVKNILPRAELCILYGESGSGKSFLALDLAMAVAKGLPWNEQKSTMGRVVYVCAEGMGGFAGRIKAYCQQNDPPHENMFHVIPAAPNLLVKEDCKELCEAIRMHGKADLVIIDTFAQTMPGANENSSDDVGHALAHCKAIRRVTGGTVLLVHHAGKDLSKGSRGWSGIKAAADAEIEVARNDKIRTFRVSKLKDGEETPTPISFELCPVTIGEDDEGEKITSCVIDIKRPTIGPFKARRTYADENGTYDAMVLNAFMGLSLRGIMGTTYLTVSDEVMRDNPPVDAKDNKTARAKVRKSIDRLIVKGDVVKRNGTLYASAFMD